MYVYVQYTRPYTENLNWTNRYEGARTFQICTPAKALMFWMKVDTMDLSLSNSMTMNLLSATADHDRQGQAAHRRYRKITHELSSLQVRAMHNNTHKFRRFNSWLHCEVLSKRVCSCSSFLDQRSGCTEFCLPCSWNKSCCYPWPWQNIKSAVHAHSGLPPDDNHLSSYTYTCLYM